ncbi:glycosyltransferase [Pareuzebyella sediminis]|uniref:glycosyltransferase n=1 Tax=Pareuzebyella sediminis TaxID=2607998 RepID=UPI0018E0D873|nr:glycosyltransferase [Pareuzebyella sediminis]
MDSGFTPTTVKSEARKGHSSPHNAIVSLNFPKQIGQLISKNVLPEIAVITTYPPRECGIATYSKDLVHSLSEKFGNAFDVSICPLETEGIRHTYDQDIRHSLNTESALDFLQAAYTINSNPRIGAVLIQHEFGLFQQNEQCFIEFLDHMDKPVIITFHTVLPNPSKELKLKVSNMAALCESIIVMTHTSAEILIKDYAISVEKIQVIAHGTHLIEYGNRDTLKIKHNLEGRTVLSTFGLLGPGKSIETTLNALPHIIDNTPDVIFLIIGRTHPTLLKEQGEAYRNFLGDRVRDQDLEDYVRFIDKFVPLETLLEYLQLTDIYLFTSKDPNQAVSGTFAYALSCGCPIVSTPIPHALEVLQNGSGTTFDFENSLELGQNVIDLLNDEERRVKMSLNGMHTTAASAWQNAAIAHAKIFEEVSKKTFSLTYQLPKIDLKHLKKMTTNVGIIQFSQINRPDIESGYTLDDNARALIAVCQHYQLTRDEYDLKYIRLYFDFIFCCFRHDGKFLNYVNKEYQFTDQNTQVNLDDACGRAIWALGYLLHISRVLPPEFDIVKGKAQFVFENSVSAMLDVTSPRAMAFIIKGIYYYSSIDDRICLKGAIETFADKLVWQFKLESDKDWHWFENGLTYGNSVIPHALLMAYSLKLKPEYRKVAKNSFDFLISKIFKDGMISVISNKKWHYRGQGSNQTFQGGEQPIDVAYTVLALRFFHKIFPLHGYDQLMEHAFAWFLGKNHLQQMVYNPCTAGCHDGLELSNVNLNQGAESTVSYLMARMAFEDLND